MIDYDAKKIEEKWQGRWNEAKAFKAVDFSKKPKFYALIEFPYPSGVGLHVGHMRAYSSLDVVSRMKRLMGYNCLFPIGWDAFGLPTENYAMQKGEHPRVVTDRNIKTFTSQLQKTGFSFDWEREVDTTSPEYYKWTQWIFIQMFKKGLAYKSKTYINYCEKCKVVLANEESQGGKCDRCGSPVVQKEKEVWFLKIRAYADRLLEGLDKVDFLPRIKLEQRNWIGRSEGAEIDFSLNCGGKVRVFTTRPDTIYGATFMVIAPEHPLIAEKKELITNLDEIYAYQDAAKRKNEFERIQVNKDKTGVEIKGIKAVNPITNKELPIFVADYVMMGYGTGAIMAVPAHDTRDWDFAKKFGVEIIEVISGGNVLEEAFTDIYSGEMVNSGFLNGMPVKKAISAMIDFIEEKGIGERKVNFNMKDWAFNRQRYWGEPIPIIYCEKCGMVHVPEEELPLRLPDLDKYQPSDNGESPLSRLTDWVNCKCPKCGGPARRETDTMPQWAGSSWYYLRYIDPNNDKALADFDKLKYWGQVDWYNGGMEHVTRHLIYSRFWNMFLYDIGAIPFEEPYARRTAQGLILGEDGEKMSKSRGNVINPNVFIDKYGADTLRTYILFIGDYEMPAPWSTQSISGSRRFLDRVWKMRDFVVDGDEYSEKHLSLMHKTIKKVTNDLLNNGYNTAIAAMMSFVNEIYLDKFITKKEFADFITLLNPVAPHITEELAESIGMDMIATTGKWPSYDENALIETYIDVPVQILGKLKGVIKIHKDATEEEIVEVAKTDMPDFFKNKQIVKVIYVKGKIINFILK